MSVMAALRGARPLDVTKHAKLCLRATLDEIDDAEHELNEELARIVLRIKAIRGAGANSERIDAVRLKPQLLQCRKVRAKVATLAKKRLALENHMDTLDNSELNQHVLHSMQKTSHALKGMGLDKALESVDQVMMDLEENHGDVSSIQNSLAASFESGEDFDWEAELAVLLDSDAYAADGGGLPSAQSSGSRLQTQISGPPTENSIRVDATHVSAPPAHAPAEAVRVLALAEASEATSSEVVLAQEQCI